MYTIVAAVVAEKTTRRTQRKATNKILPAITDESQNQSADSVSSNGSKKVVKKTEAQAVSSLLLLFDEACPKNKAFHEDQVP